MKIKSVNQKTDFSLKLILLYCQYLPLHSLPYESHPADAFLSGASVDFVHFRHAGGAGRDKEQGFVFISHFSNYEPLKWDDWWFVLRKSHYYHICHIWFLLI